MPFTSNLNSFDKISYIYLKEKSHIKYKIKYLIKTCIIDKEAAKNQNKYQYITSAKLLFEVQDAK